MNTTNQQARVLNLTPATVSNWSLDSTPDVLIINPDASLHQRAALAWSMAIENLTILEAGQLAHGNDPGNDRAVFSVAIERMLQIVTLLQDIGARTAALEGGAA